MDQGHNVTIIKKTWWKNHKLLFRLLLASVILNVSLILYGSLILFWAEKRIYFTYFRRQKLNSIDNIERDTNYIKQRSARTELVEMLPNEPDQIVFIGNSLTEAFPLQEIFQNIKLKNRGVSGNTSKDILLRIGAIVRTKPKKIFLEVGYNDIARKISMDTLLNNFRNINTIILQESPTTKVFVQSLLPVGVKSLSPKIEFYNQKMQEYCLQHNITFINLYTFFFKNNGLDTSLTYDGVHLKAKGYFLWKQLIDKYVNEE